MKRPLSLLLSACLLTGTLTTGVLASTLQSNQAVYRLTQDPVGTQPFSYSATESHSTTLVPVGTVIESDQGHPLMVEVFTYNQSSGYWTQSQVLTSQTRLEVTNANEIYHISTLDPNSSIPGGTLDRGIWVRGGGNTTLQPITITGEPVDEWALDLVNSAIAANLIPAQLKGQDLRESITRVQFAALTVQLYESVSGQTITPPAHSPFSDTSDPAVAKAWAMGFVSGVSDTEFGVDVPLNREQAATMLLAVYRKFHSKLPDVASNFTDQSAISSWAREAVSVMSYSGIVTGYGDGRFAPKDPAQRQACLIMALRLSQTVHP